MRGSRLRPRSPEASSARRTGLRHPGAHGVAQASVALPRAGVCGGDLQRDPRADRSGHETDPPGRGVGHRRAGPPRHLRFGPGPPARGVSRRTARRANQLKATRRTSTAERLVGVDALGVDEHVWSHTGPPGTGMATGIVDHSRDERGRVRARLLDLVPGRSGAAYADWLAERGEAFAGGIHTATLDPFHGYANAIRDEFPEAITVLDAFHVVKLGGRMVDEVRRWVQQDTLGHRGRAGDPLYGIRRTLKIGAGHLPPRQVARPDAKLAAGDPHHEVTLAWHCYQKLRAVYHARTETGRRLVADVVMAFPTCPISEVARLGRTLRRGKAAILAYVDTAGASNGSTEAVNGVIETTRRIACGFRNFTNYRLRCLLAAGGNRPYRTTQ
ncbi:ISL3 family transposase [Kocuria rosea]|uniref:ISL3 family transposase n=1 Tax=Kocuria rosea TaxID=1275 RepID=UPI002011E5F3|nr:ISL3 family transposase [Kocuria rosea]